MDKKTVSAGLRFSGGFRCVLCVPLSEAEEHEEPQKTQRTSFPIK